jgi:hypothetical protein
MTVRRHGVERLTGDPHEPFGRGVPVSDHWSYSTTRTPSKREQLG